MGSIKDYIIEIIFVGVGCSLVGVLIPDNSKLRPYIRLVCALIITLVLATPVTKMIGYVPELIDSFKSESIVQNGDDNAFYNNVLGKAIDKIKENLKEQIEQKFKVTPQNIFVDCNTDDIENIVINNIVIYLEKGNSFMKSDIEEYVGSMMNCKCEVVYEK